MVVWRIIDGKPGHENQSLGLVNALMRCLPGVEVFDIPAETKASVLWYWMIGRFPVANNLPDPDLVIGAGHATHFSLLAARRAHGGRAVVLMKPSLPIKVFDLCVIPAHDDVEPGRGVFITRGVLNPLSSEGVHDPKKALFLIGGPSKHHGWDDESLVSQIIDITKASPQVSFNLTTSRRTPGAFLEQLKKIDSDNLCIIPVEQTAPGWVAGQLAESSLAWVTEDSVSMVYEALTSGVGVGILEVPRITNSHVSAGLEDLINEGVVVPYRRWVKESESYRNEKPLDEAWRCADWLIEKWLNEN
ncbi:hypothetical protein BOW51_03945 [Solemya velesiana gill symbiont]|uniref:Nucleoside-diphosphate sugar epimerase n=1 Tax=Solemya velesiana gill symbiont TaxID=1918948 RepID=A0A1T2KWB7_9GAMM|nr:hypothetical protein BOW51_03945 [Solemya velesiana gill symbiont]